MGKTMYKKATDLLEGLKKKHGNRISKKLFLSEIQIQIGANYERTIKPYVKLMEDLNLVKEDGDHIDIR